MYIRPVIITYLNLITLYHMSIVYYDNTIINIITRHPLEGWRYKLNIYSLPDTYKGGGIK